MIVLSVGMPRAGSGWHYNLIRDLMRTTGCAEATEIRSRFHLQDILTEVNCNIGVLSARRLARVALPAILGNTFVIKAHSKPTAASRILRAVGLLRITYIYRDPRDAMLSAMNYGQRALSKGRPNAFSAVSDFGDAVPFMLEYVRIGQAWAQEESVLISRYEDLLEDYDRECRRLCRHLGLDFEEPAVKSAIEGSRPGRAEGRQGTHFFKGQIGRFREAFTHEQQSTLVESFGPFLGTMGYAP
ncbi:MAG: sulfotransferase domain-containing protein [Anaerolineales bacterium]